MRESMIGEDSARITRKSISRTSKCFPSSISFKAVVTPLCYILTNLHPPPPLSVYTITANNKRGQTVRNRSSVVLIWSRGKNRGSSNHGHFVFRSGVYSHRQAESRQAEASKQAYVGIWRKNTTNHTYTRVLGGYCYCFTIFLFCALLRYNCSLFFDFLTTGNR